MNSFWASFVLLAGLSLSPSVFAGDKEMPAIGLFGTKPIQIGIDEKGLHKKEGGFICDLEASLGGAKYSEWGQTEEDARSIVTKKCGDKSGILLCKRDKAKCREDK